MVGVFLGDFDRYSVTYVPYTRTVLPTTEDIEPQLSIVVRVLGFEHGQPV